LKIRVNGEEKFLKDYTTLYDFLKQKLVKLDVIVEYNYSFVDRSSWNKITLNENDNIEVIKLIGGG
jgi:sulfur carrier protein